MNLFTAIKHGFPVASRDATARVFLFVYKFLFFVVRLFVSFCSRRRKNTETVRAIIRRRDAVTVHRRESPSALQRPLRTSDICRKRRRAPSLFCTQTRLRRDVFPEILTDGKTLDIKISHGFPRRAYENDTII